MLYTLEQICTGVTRPYFISISTFVLLFFFIYMIFYLHLYYNLTCLNKLIDLID